MDCAKYQDQLTAAALDATGAVDPRHRTEWEAHLASCGDCRAELERRRSFLAAMDQVVARTTEGEPSPGFAGRVRERIAEQPAPATRWLSGWLPATASAVAVVALLAIWIWMKQEPVQPNQGIAPPAVAKRNPVPSTPVTKPDANPEEKREPLGILRPRRVAGQQAIAQSLPMPEVLIPRDEREGVRLFLAASQVRRADAIAENEAQVVLLAKPVESPGLTIQPLQVERLQVPPILESGKASQTQ